MISFFAFLCKWYRHFIIYFSFALLRTPKRLSFVNKTKTLCRAQRAKRRVWDTHSEAAAFITHYYYFNSSRYENICMIFIAFNLRPPFSLIAIARENPKLAFIRTETIWWKPILTGRRLARQVHIGEVTWLDLSLLHIQIQAPLTPLLITTDCPRDQSHPVTKRQFHTPPACSSRLLRQMLQQSTSSALRGRLLVIKAAIRIKIVCSVTINIIPRPDPKAFDWIKYLLCGETSNRPFRFILGGALAKPAPGS